MLLGGPFEKFVEASPVSVMMRGIIENLFHPERLFEERPSHNIRGYRCCLVTTFADTTGFYVLCKTRILKPWSEAEACRLWSQFEW